MRFIKLTLYTSIFLLTAAGFAAHASAATNVYYSVGQNATDHSSGGNVSITSGVATFTVAQTAANLGVGDRLTAGGNIYYLASKTDLAHWNVVTKLGAVPSDLSSTAVTSLHHEYTSLSAAIAGASDSNHLNTLNLVTGNYILNIPCYYDSGANTTAVDITGYTTGASNYIKIYTPNNIATEANQSQRHQGKWDNNKYRLEVTDAQLIGIGVGNVRIDGLQAKNLSATSNGQGGFLVGGAGASCDVRISNNILQGYAGVGDFSHRGIEVWDNASDLQSGTVRVWNNTVYDYQGTSVTTNSDGIFIYDYNGNTTLYAYNNTVYNCQYNYYRSVEGGVFVAKNNLSQDSTGTELNYSGTFDSASDYNLSGGASNTGGAHDRINQPVNFVDRAGRDFHLAQNDTAARNQGTDLSGDSHISFTTDIDNDTRAGVWDIGADETPNSSTDTSLILHQTFNGDNMNWADTGAEAVDQSMWGNNGDVNGATAVSGKIGQALSFNGTSDYVGMGDPASGILDFSAGQSFTLSAWVYRTGGSPSIAQRIIAKNNSGDGIGYRLIDEGSGDYAIRISDPTNSAQVNSSVMTTLNTWHHVVGVIDRTGQTLRLYVDGVENGTPVSTASVGSLANALNFNIGAPSDLAAVDCFMGIIDEARVYNRALSATEIANLYRTDQAKINSPQTDNMKNGLAGIWSLDGADISGTTAYDRSGNGNNGTISGATPALGKLGQALSFNGTSDYVDSSAIANNIETGSVTVSAWIRLTSNHSSSDATKVIFSSQDSPSTNDILLCLKGTGTTICNGTAGAICFTALNVGVYYSACTSETSWSANTWYHVVGMIDTAGGGEKVYVDGVQDGSNPNTNRGTTPSSISYIGAEYNSSPVNNFSGSLDEVRVYNRALSATDVGDLYRSGQMATNVSQNSNSTSGLAGLWSFNGPDISGTTAYDRSGNGNNGTINGATPAIGKIGQALSFNGTSNYVNVGSPASLDDITVKTLTAWIKPNSFGGQGFGRIIDKEDCVIGTCAWLFSIGTGDTSEANDNSLSYVQHFSTGTFMWSSPTNSIRTGEWQHVAVVYDNSSDTNDPVFYINGVPQATTEKSSGSGTRKSDAANNAYIGNQSVDDPPVNNGFDGQIDEVRFYNRALTAQEVSDLYHLGQATIRR